MRVEPVNLEFDYLNWKGNTVHRRVQVQGQVYYGISEYYPEPTWLVNGTDLDRNVARTYKMSNMANVVEGVGGV